MFCMPRVALGTVQPAADLRAVAWGVAEVFRREGLQVQSFLSRSCFTDYPSAAAVSGCNPRHLDSWLMSPDLSREVFTHGVGGADVALVQGKFASAAEGGFAGGRLESLCDWLDLPAVAVVDAAAAVRCCLPARPGRVDAVILDGVPAGEVERMSVNLESLWGLPVIGALQSVPALRQLLAEVPRSGRPPRQLYEALGGELSSHWHWRRVDRLTARPKLGGVPTRLFRDNNCSSAATSIALAYDEAFDCYFPDTLDLLELRGATISAFSPLRDDRLPPEIDVVYVGCGHPEGFAERLAANDCMKVALRNHLRQGKRLYAEGGGLAYLCQALEDGQARWHGMAGVFPAVARLQRPPREPAPVEMIVRHPNWLARAGGVLRGYRNGQWKLEPVGVLSCLAEEQPGQYDLVQAGGAVGSRVHLNFAANADLLSGFFQPFCRQCCEFGTRR